MDPKISSDNPQDYAYIDAAAAINPIDTGLSSTQNSEENPVLFDDVIQSMLASSTQSSQSMSHPVLPKVFPEMLGGLSSDLIAEITKLLNELLLDVTTSSSRIQTLENKETEAKAAERSQKYEEATRALKKSIRKAHKKICGIKQQDFMKIAMYSAMALVVAAYSAFVVVTAGAGALATPGVAALLVSMAAMVAISETGAMEKMQEGIENKVGGPPWLGKLLATVAIAAILAAMAIINPAAIATGAMMAMTTVMVVMQAMMQTGLFTDIVKACGGNEELAMYLQLAIMITLVVVAIGVGSKGSKPTGGVEKAGVAKNTSAARNSIDDAGDASTDIGKASKQPRSTGANNSRKVNAWEEQSNLVKLRVATNLTQASVQLTQGGTSIWAGVDALKTADAELYKAIIQAAIQKLSTMLSFWSGEIDMTQADLTTLLSKITGRQANISESGYGALESNLRNLSSS